MTAVDADSAAISVLFRSGVAENGDLGAARNRFSDRRVHNGIVLGLLGVALFSGVVVGAVVTSLGEPPAPVDPPPSASVGEPAGPPSTTRLPPLPPVPGEQNPNHTAPNGPLPQKPGTLIPGR